MSIPFGNLRPHKLIVLLLKVTVVRIPLVFVLNLLYLCASSPLAFSDLCGGGTLPKGVESLFEDLVFQEAECFTAAFTKGILIVLQI